MSRPRIRTVKPELLLHEGLWDLEVAHPELPIFRAWVGMFTQVDREGRFEWRPRRLGAQIAPYWQGDFGDVLDAFAKAGMIESYEVDGITYGHIPTFCKHQVINKREPDSTIPVPPTSACTDAHVHARADTDETVHARVEGKGTGREREGKASKLAARAREPACPPPVPVPSNLREQEHAVSEAVTALVRGWSREWEARTATPASSSQLASVGKLGAWLVEYRRRCPERSLEDLASTMLGSFFVAKEAIDRPRVEWLAEDPGRYLDKVYRPKREVRDKSAEIEAARQAELAERWRRDELERVPPPKLQDLVESIGRAVDS